MAENNVEQRISFAGRLKRLIVPAMILVMAVAIVVLIEAPSTSLSIGRKAQSPTRIDVILVGVNRLAV